MKTPNPPAFPHQHMHNQHATLLPGAPGMTLRDVFAAAAIAGVVQTPTDNEMLAEWAYALADAMLAERSKE